MSFSLILVIVILLIVNNQSNKKVNKFSEFSRELHKKGKISDHDYECLTGIEFKNNLRKSSSEDIDISLKVEDEFIYDKTIQQPAYDEPLYEIVSQSKEKEPIKSSQEENKYIENQNDRESQSNKENPIERENQKVNNMNIVFGIGILFVILAGLIFATTTWQSLENIVKFMFILAVTAAFFGVSYIAEKKLNLIKTGMSFFALGSVFALISVLSMGILKIFEPVLSMEGESKYIVYMLAFIALGTSAFRGALKYQSKLFSWVVHGSATFAIIFLMLAFRFESDILALALSIYSLLYIFAADRIMGKDFGKLDIITSVIRSFATKSTGILSAIALLVTNGGSISFIALTILALTFLKSIFNEDEKNQGIYFFTFMMFVAFIKLVMPNAVDDYFITIVATTTTLTVLSMLSGFSGTMQKLMRKVSVYISCVAVLFGGSILLVSNDWTFISQITITILFFNVIWVTIKSPDVTKLSLVSMINLLFLIGLSKLITTKIADFATILSSLVLITFLIYNKIKIIPIRTMASDIIFSISTLICTFAVLAETNSITEVRIINSIALSIITYIIAMDKLDIFNRVYSFAFTFIIGILLKSFYLFFNVSINFEYMALQYFCVILAFELVLMFLNHHKMQTRLCEIFIVPFEIAVFITGTILTSIGLLIYPWLLFGFCVLKTYMLIKENPSNYFYIGSLMLYVATFMTGIKYLSISPIYLKMFIVNIFLGIIALVYFGGYLLNKFLSKMHELKKEIRISTLVGLVITSGMLLFSFTQIEMLEPWHFIVVAILPIITYAFMYMEKQSVIGFAPVFVLIATISEYCFRTIGTQDDTLLYVFSGIFLMFMIIGRLLHQYIIDKDDISFQVDWISIGALIPVYWIYNNGDKYWQFFTGIALIALIIGCYNRFKDKNGNQIILTTASITGCFVFLIQPFFEVPYLLEREFTLLPFILLCVAIKKIWPENKAETNIICYGFAIISTILLAGDAISSEEIVDTIIIGVSAAIMLMIAFTIKSKRWFTLSTMALIFLGIYMSREFWLNLAWWIYLLTVGLSLIIFAAINEKQKQRGKSLKNKVADLMSDWGW